MLSLHSHQVCQSPKVRYLVSLGRLPDILCYLHFTRYFHSSCTKRKTRLFLPLLISHRSQLEPISILDRSSCHTVLSVNTKDLQEQSDPLDVSVWNDFQPRHNVWPRASAPTYASDTNQAVASLGMPDRTRVTLRAQWQNKYRDSVSRKKLRFILIQKRPKQKELTG